MTDLVQVKSGVLGDRTEMPNLVENELGYRKDEKALYIGTSSGNVRLCGADDIGGGGGAEELNAIGDAIRDITGGTEFIPVADMPEKVYEVYEQGQAEGVETGKQEMVDAWWDNMTNQGARTAYYQTFSKWVWLEGMFKPTSTLIMKGNNNGTFKSTSMESGAQPIDLQALEDELGYPILNTTGATYLSELFHSSTAFVTVGVIDASTCTPTDGTTLMLYQPSYQPVKIKSIKKIIVSANTKVGGMLRQATGLEHCIFEGTIAQNGLDAQWSTKLDKESHESIINCLSTETSGLSVNVSKTAVNKAFETSSGANDGSTSAEWAALKATKPNWTITEA